MRTAFGWLLLGLAAVSACGRETPAAVKAGNAASPPSKSGAGATASARLTISVDRRDVAELAALPLDEARRERTNAFRLAPDRRFLIALSEIELLLRRAPAVRLHVAFRDGAWRIDSSGAPIGSVPEAAGYREYRRVLGEHARRIAGETHPAPRSSLTDAEARAIREQIDRFDPAAAVAALRRIDERWPDGPARPDARLVSLASHALAVLSFHCLDTLELADLLGGRALAAAALRQAFGGSPDAGDDALLAEALGYHGDAVRIAAALPPDDALRLELAGDAERLSAAANRPGADRRTKYLALLSLRARGDFPGWERLVRASFPDEGFSLAIVRSAAGFRRLEVGSMLGQATMYATLAELGASRPAASAASSAEAQPPIVTGPAALVADTVRRFVEAVERARGVESAAVVRQFEDRLSSQARGLRGPIWDEELFRAWHRAFFYSGLQILGGYYLDQLVSAPGADELARYLQGSPEGVAGQFATWYSDLSSIASGRPPTDAQFDHLASLTELGGSSVSRLARDLKGRRYQGGDSTAVLARRVAARLDGRPAQVASMQEIAYYPLQDLAMVERLCTAWLAEGWKDEGRTSAQCLRVNGDVKGLSALLRDRNVDVETRVDILYRYCLSRRSSEALCRESFPRLAEEAAYSEGSAQAWSYYLWNRLHDYAGAARACELWLAHNDQSAGIIWHVFRGRLANLTSKQGRHEEAWRIIEPSIAMGQGNVMTWGSEILGRLGRGDEAYALARRATDRYPKADDGRASFAALLWNVKRNSEAALVLDPPEAGYKVGASGFRDEVAPRFVETFAGSQDERIESAFSAMQAQGIPSPSLLYVISALDEAGRHDLAFRLNMKLPPVKRGGWDAMEQRLAAYRSLEKAKGRAEALLWLRGSIAANERESAAEVFFWKKAWDVLWDAVPPDAEPTMTEWIWLLRAEAATAAADPGATWRKELQEHYGGERSQGAAKGDLEAANRAVGRYLMGLDDRATMLAATSSPAGRCRAAFALGLQDIAAGRYEEASDWYQLVQSTCWREDSWHFVYWVNATLREWYSFDRNLRAAAEQKIW